MSLNHRYWASVVREAERELDAATKRSAVDAGRPAAHAREGRIAAARNLSHHQREGANLIRTKPLAITLGLVLATAGAADAQPKRVAPFEQPFAVAMAVNDPDIVVASHGPFELLARCFTPTGFPRSRLVIRSSVDGWALTQAVDPTRTNLLGLPAGEEPIGGVTVSVPEIVSVFGGSAMAPDGSVLTVDGARVTIGMLILPGVDCAFVGVATLLKVPATP
jgi:hypothetical protein